MNLLDTETNTDARRSDNREKVALFGWTISKESGAFAHIDKKIIGLDSRYQRSIVSEKKVHDIARNLDWRLFGVLLVIVRGDGTFWCFDGGHRLRAVLRRSDVSNVPCMVYGESDVKAEANAFLGANIMKSIVSAYCKHKASLLAGDPVSEKCEDVVTSINYIIVAPNNTRVYGFAAISTLRNLILQDETIATNCMRALASIAVNGEKIQGSMLEAYFVCQKKLDCDITSGTYLHKLSSATIPGIELAMRRQVHITGLSGAAIEAKAILDIINKGSRKKILFNE